MSAYRNVLIVAFNFPPHGGGGVQRSVKFVRYLPEFGWRPIVLTSSAEAAAIQDTSLLKEIPSGVQIHRVSAPSIRRLQARGEGWKLGKAVSFFNLLLQAPDADLLWTWKARSTLERIIRDQQPEVVYTTSGPYSSHLLGLWATSSHRIPWFADFRDPWSSNLVIPYLPGYRAINRVLERNVLARANRIACVSQPWLADLQANLGKDPEKFLWLPNGYDESDVKPLPLDPRSKRFTLTHIGSFHRNRRPFQLIAAVDSLIEGGHVPVSQFRILFVGNNAGKHVPARVPFECHDYVPHQDLDHFRKRADAFLLILDTSAKNRGKYSGKIYELMAANRPILAIVPKHGVAQKLIEETRTGKAVGGDTMEIAKALEQMFLDWKNGNKAWDPDWEVIQKYQRRKITAKLAEEFDKLAASGGTG